MRVDTELLSSIYMERLQSLRSRAEESGISKSGSVEVLRARPVSYTHLTLPTILLV